MSDSVRITVTADGAQAQRAFRDINRSLDTLRGRAVSTAAGVRILDTAVQGLERSMRTLRGRTAAADNALRDFRTAGLGASTSMRTLITRLDAADSRFDDLSGRTTTLRRDMDDLGGSIDGVNGGLGDLRGDLRGLAVAGDSASSALGGGGGGGAAGGGGLAGSLAGVGAVLGASVLPSIGALAPMLAGLAGVGGAASLAMDGMKKQAKELKGPLEDWRKAAEKVVLPRTAKAVDTLKGAMKDLTPVIETGGKAFGEIAQSAARFADSPAFKSALIKNVEMGSEFVKDFADNMGTFTHSFLDFGTKSQPTVDALQNLVGGAFGKGMPGMFRELTQGVDGSADVIDGLAYLVNDSLLPSLGKVAGSFADSFGPLVGEMLVTAGDQVSRLATLFDGAAEALEPLANVGADAFRAFNELAAIGTSVAGSFAKEVGGALFESLTAVAGVDVSELDDGFRGLSDWVKENQGEIRGAMLGVAQSITSMVTAGVESLPTLFGAFRTVTEGILLGVDGLVSTLAGTFGDLPVVGDTFKDWNESFDEVAGGFRDNLTDIGGTIDTFVGEAVPRLNRAQITMSVDQAEASLEHIKAQLEDPELTKERKAKLTADKKDAEDELAAAKRELAKFDKASAKAKLEADSGPFAEAMRWVRQQKIPPKTGRIGADTGSFWASVSGLRNRVLGTSYINVKYINPVASDALRRDMGKSADGNIYGRAFADGGIERHVAQIAQPTMRVWAEPETGGEAYIPLAESKRPRSLAILSEVADRFGYGLEEFAGGGIRKSARSAARGARDEIRAATSGATEDRLLKLMSSIAGGHMKMATALKKVSGELDKASSKLRDLKSSASQLADSVRSGVVSAADVTRGADRDKPVTVRSIVGSLVQSRDKATAFADALKQLRKRGLNKTMLRQVAEAGIEGGGLETAGALLRASSSELKSINSLQGQINTAAGVAGKTTADALYGSQLKAQEKLVKALDRLADALKAKKKAAGGIGGGLTVVGEDGPELLRLPEGSMVYPAGQSRQMAWASMLNMPSPVSRRAGVPASGTQVRPIIVHQTIELDGRVVAKQIFDPMRGEIHRRGGLRSLERD